MYSLANNFHPVNNVHFPKASQRLRGIQSHHTHTLTHPHTHTHAHPHTHPHISTIIRKHARKRKEEVEG